MADPFDVKELKDWWNHPDGKPVRDELKNMFAAAIGDMRKSLRAQKFYEAFGHEVEATLLEDVLQLADGLAQDQVQEKQEHEEERKKR